VSDAGTNGDAGTSGAGKDQNRVPFLMTPGGLVRLGLLTALCLLVSGAGIYSRPIRGDIVLFPVLVAASVVLTCALVTLLVIRRSYRDEG
jgi:hypothetical protein